MTERLQARIAELEAQRDRANTALEEAEQRAVSRARRIGELKEHRAEAILERNTAEAALAELRELAAEYLEDSESIERRGSRRAIEEIDEVAHALRAILDATKGQTT